MIEKDMVDVIYYLFFVLNDIDLICFFVFLFEYIVYW